MKALIVEDNNASQILLKLHLKDVAECVCAENGKEAFDIFREAVEDADPFDLICLDINMPEMDGHEFLQKIREYENDKKDRISTFAKVIMTTALGEPEQVVQAYKEGCEDYIVKPVKKSDLLKKIEDLGLCIGQE